jgi:prenylcysteine oxidase/farnesylcysteine lyase
MRKVIFSALVAASLSRAFQFPFDISNLWWSDLQPPPSPDVVVPPRSPRIAIIGAGAGGSSAAFWIAKAKERHGLDIAIDIYERNDYIGGRKLPNSSYFSTPG